MYSTLVGFFGTLKPAYLLLIQGFILLLVPLILWRGFGLSKIFPLSVLQIFTGILLGPTVFGSIDPTLQKAIFGNVSGISAVATIAVCIFGFLAGSELDKTSIRTSGRSIIAIGVFGMMASWVIGSLAGLWLYYAIPTSHGPGVQPLIFASAYGLAIAVCALPVLMLIMRDTDVMQRRLGAVTLAAAGVSDTIMWLGLALVAALAGIGLTIGEALGRAVGGLALTAVFIVIANVLFKRLIASGASEGLIIGMTAMTVFACSAVTGITELHPVLGAFLCGVFLLDKVRDIGAHRFDMTTVMVLMPFFFLATGLRTSFPYNNVEIWLIFGVSIVICVAAKAIGSAIPARMSGEPWSFAIATGMLLQTKGLMGLIVITVFYDKQVVSESVFSAIVVMCMVATGITAPIIRWMRKRYGDEMLEGSAAKRPADTMAPVPASAEAVSKTA